MKREDFVQLTVANTISRYLTVYCSPHPVETAHERCVADAEKLADRMWGVVVESSEEIVVRPRRGMSRVK